MTEKRALVFPGQGAQTVGMGKAVYDAFAEAREVFQEVDDALNQKLSQLIFEGPIEDLTLTENTQPALMATSIALLRVLEKQGGMAVENVAALVAGHSLGEYTALCAAGALSVGETARLLRIRGEAMQQAVPAGQGAMAAIIGLDVPEVEKLCAGSGGICELANDNSDGQVVISGTKEAVEAAEAVAKEAGAKRFVLLNVSAPFHCSLMQPAAERMAEALAAAEVKKPVVPVLANVNVQPISDPEAIREALVAQVTGRVRWRESVQFMVQQGISCQVEIGAGNVLTGLARRICRELNTVTVNDPEGIEAFLSGLSGQKAA